MPLTEMNNLSIDKENRLAGSAPAKDLKKAVTPKMDKNLDKEEHMLMDNPRRFVILPIQYEAIWQMYKKAEVQLFLLI